MIPQLLCTVLALGMTLPAAAQIQAGCPVDWSALTDLDGPDQGKLILGKQAGAWTKNDLDAMMQKDFECLEASTDPDSMKQAYRKALQDQLYPNAVAALERRTQAAIAQRYAAEHAQHEAEMAQAAAAQAPAPAVPARRRSPAEQRAEAEPQAVAPAANAEVAETPADAGAPAAALAQEPAAGKSGSVMLLVLLGLAALAGGWGWNRFVRNRCPQCRSTAVACTGESEVDRWRGTKQVSERNSRGTNTRHMQTTYVHTHFEYECTHCQAQWEKLRKEELGEHSSLGRFLSGY